MQSRQTSVVSHQTSEVTGRRAGVALLTSSHAVDDLYQGAVPALIPFLVVAYHYDYLAVSGITVAATLISSVAQPAFGLLADRRSVSWLWMAGMLTAAAGISLAGLPRVYILTWLAVALSGLGVAAYHPQSAREVRIVGGGSAQVMGWFALGGNLGFAVGPIAVTVLLGVTGLRGTPLLLLPALAMAAVALSLRKRLRPPGPPNGGNRAPAGEERDDAHRLQRHRRPRHPRRRLAGGPLRAGTQIRWGYALVIPGLVGLVLAPGPAFAFAAAIVCGLGVYLPFAVHTTLAQEYLPNRLGTASGVTLGLAVSAGGLASPLLGLIADAYSLTVALAVLLVLPLAALAMSTRLSETRTGRPDAPVRAQAVAKRGPG